MHRSRTAGPDRSRLGLLWERPAFRRLVFSQVAITAVVVFGTAGYVLLGWSPFDALYMVVITISTVGYGEVRPMRSAAERIHTIGVIATGIVAVSYAVASLVAMLTEGEIRRALGHQRMRRQIDELSGHIIIAGYGRIGSLVAEDLSSNAQAFVVIERSADRIPDIERRGFLYVAGDARDEAVLLAAGLDRARALVSVMAGDADNVFVTLTAKQIAPGVEIIARAEQPSTHKTLRQAGASHIVMPAAIGAHRIASLLTNPSAVEFAELVTTHSRLALEMDEVPIRAGSSLVGHSIAEADVRKRTNALVVAVKRRDGHVEFPASHESPIEAGDVVVLLGRRASLDQFRKLYGG
ncbi:MAG TPA: potassium channel protein [Isosphaeraceae bacterium]